jgi:septal ring factor EnvC (AmiA/AmiB activator)
MRHFLSATMILMIVLVIPLLFANTVFAAQTSQMAWMSEQSLSSRAPVSEVADHYASNPPSQQINAYTTDPCFLQNQSVGHVDSNITIDINIETEFQPNQTITIKFSDTAIPIPPTQPEKTDQSGSINLSLVFKVPEVPRDAYPITVSDGNTTKNTSFTVIPWMWIDKKDGFVGDPATVTGTGFAANVNVSTLYRDVSFGAIHYDWAQEWSDEGFKFEWEPYLGNLNLGTATTNANGTFSFTFTVPESYGGYHPIYGQETVSCVRSGWMPCYPQSAFFSVKTKAWTETTIGPSGQYITLKAYGLPLPVYSSRTFDCRTQQNTTEERNWTLVIDFGPDKQCVSEKSFILNNEFDPAWASRTYLPFGYYYSTKNCTLSRVWNGTLCWLDAQGQYHEGSHFLKTPALMPGNYTITIYEHNVKTDQDETQYQATAPYTILKDQLNVRVTTGSLHLKNESATVYVETDLDGNPTDPTTLSIQLYQEQTLLQTLDPTRVDTGTYTASFTTPDDGNYLIKAYATKAFTDFTLNGLGISSFTANPTLEGFNATLTQLNGNIATIQTSLQQITADLSQLNPQITSIQGGIATITTDIGQIKANMSLINPTLTNIQGQIATIHTDVGDIKASTSQINLQLASIQGGIATITSGIGEINANVSLINPKLTNLEEGIATVTTDIGQIKANLSQINPQLASIQGGIATITTDIGQINASLSQINPRLISIQGGVATITSDIGEINANLSAVNAKLVQIQTENGQISVNIATIQTDIGTIRTSFDNINAQIISVGANLVDIKTTLGEIQGNVTDIHGKTVEIQTKIGDISTTTDAIKSQSVLTELDIALTIVAIIVAALAGVLILRKLYK